MTARRAFTVDLHQDTSALKQIALARGDDAFGAHLPFGDPRWIEHWYESFTPHTDVEALVAVVNDAALPASAGTVARSAMAVPLIRRRRYGLPLIEFADRGVTDYNIPIVGPREPVEQADLDAALKALLESLRPFAALRLRKMPFALDGKPNPLSRAMRGEVSTLSGHHLDVEGNAERFDEGLSNKKRKELRRGWRNLEALGDVAFEEATTADARAAVFRMIQASQRQRVPAKGHAYVLEDPGYRQFYDGLVRDARFGGFALLFALWLDGAPIAGLLAVRRGHRLTCLRIGQSDDAELRRFGPGRQLVYRTALWAAENGLKVFDLSIGQSDLKDWFHCETMPLLDADLLLSGAVPLGRKVA